MSTPPMPPEPVESAPKKPVWKRPWFWVAAILILILIPVLAGEEPVQQAESPTPATTEEPTTEPEPTEAPTEEPEETEPPEPAFTAPKPIVLNGNGSKVETIRLAANSPVVLTASHSGSANFVVELVGQGTNELLVNEIGSYQGQVAVDEIRSGRYRVPVDADGTWTLRIEQPVPKPGDKNVIGKFSGRGSKVIALQSDSDLQPIITGQHRGQENFIVELVGFGTLEGSVLLFNEIGNFSGEALEDVPGGDFLLAVQADGNWTIRFRR